MILQDREAITFWSFSGYGGRRMGSAGWVFWLGAFLARPRWKSFRYPTKPHRGTDETFG